MFLGGTFSEYAFSEIPGGLPVDRAIAGHTVAAGALVQVHVLPVAVATVGHTASPGGLLQTSTILSVNALAGHTADLAGMIAFIPGISPENQTYVVLADTRTLSILTRGESVSVPSESRALGVNAWGEFVQ